MKKTKFIIISIKKYIIPVILIFFTICLIIFSRQNLSAAKSGLELFATSVVPSLFPFFIATELLGYTNIIHTFGRLLNKIMRPLFNVPGEGAFPFLMGIISGYPVGAKIVTRFRKENICTKEEGERLIAFTNNSGPLFIIGTVGISLLGDLRTGILLFITHLLACITVGVIFRFWKTDTKKHLTRNFEQDSSIKTVSISNLGEVLGNSIMSSINTILMIGGFVVLFSVVISILKSSGVIQISSYILNYIFSTFSINTDFSSALITGIIELTNGVKEVANITSSNISTNIIFCAFLLGFGGFSVLLQVFSITSKSDISIKPYIIGKLLHGIFAAFYTYLILKNTMFFNLELQPVFSNVSSKVLINNFDIYAIVFLVLILLFIVYKYWKLIKTNKI